MPPGLQRRDGLPGTFAQPVGDGRDGQRPPRFGEPDKAPRPGGPTIGLPFQRFVHRHAALGEQPPAAGEAERLAKTSGDTPAGDVLESVGCPGGRNALQRERLHDGRGQRMLRSTFERQKTPGSRLASGGPRQIRDRGPPLGQRAGLVQHDRIDTASGLQRLGVPDEDTQSGAFADADHDGRRRGQSQRAGTGDDQHGDQRQQAADEPLGGVEHEPEEKRRDGQQDDDRHEDGGDAVHEPLHRSLAALRILHEANDLREHRTFADLDGPVTERAALIDRAGENAVRWALGHRNGFAAQHALVHIGRTLRNDPVHGDPAARTHRKQIARTHVADRDLALGAVGADTQHGDGSQAGQLADGLHRAAFRALFEQTAQQHEGHDDARCLEIDMRRDTARRPEGGKKEVEEAEQVGDAGAQSHQCIHVRGTVAQLAPCPGEKTAAEPEDEGRGEQPRHPRRPCTVHEEHPDDEQWHGQRQCGRDARFQRPIPGVVLALGLSGGIRQIDHQIVPASRTACRSRSGAVAAASYSTATVAAA